MTRTEFSAVHAPYRDLHKYLRDRFADTVVLTFGQIEDLMGCSLPEVARREDGWWTRVEPNGTMSQQSQVWVQARRIATPNLRAEIVKFERMPD